MPIFARRRLQAMLSDLATQTKAAKARDWLGRLEDKNTQNALAAEAELGVLWALSKATSVTIDPEFAETTRRPDCLCETLFPSGPAVVEVTAISDDSFSDKDAMNRVAELITHFLAQHRKRLSKRLSFKFAERQYYESGKFHRERRVSRTFELTDTLRDRLRTWVIASRDSGPTSLRLQDDQIDVTIQIEKYVHPQSRVFSSMPAVAYDLEDNPLYKALLEKRDQLADVPTRFLKCVVLVDAGCYLLREFHGLGMSPEQKSGPQIVRYFLQKPTNTVDIVCVLSPKRDAGFHPALSKPYWKMHATDRRYAEKPPKSEFANLETALKSLPTPMFDAYQARPLHEQGSLKPQARGWYLGNCFETRAGSNAMTIKISARLLQEFMAGRLDQQQFQNFAFGADNKNQIAIQLALGTTIKSAKIEPAGLDADDDLIVFDFEPDAAAGKLKLP